MREHVGSARTANATIIFMGNTRKWMNLATDMDIVQQAIDYDVAIELLAKMRSDAIRRKHSATSEEERQQADHEIHVYNTEESILNGYGSDDARLSVYDKIFRFYGPIIKSRNEDTR